MSYRLLMHPLVSRGEMQVFKALSDAGLTRGMTTNKWIPLSRPDGTKLWTKPDAIFQLLRKLLYLDGDKVHVWRIMDQDDEIMALLPANDWQGLRVRYHAPLTRKRLIEIVEEVRRWLKE